MPRLIFAGAALVAIACVSLARPGAADGEILLTHAKALAGNVTPGDTPSHPILISIPVRSREQSFVAAGKTEIQVASHNVTIDGFKFDGIVAGGLHWKIESMRIVSNGRHGIA